MKILIIHNILWTHYKSVLFEAIEQNKARDMEICVLQIAKNDISRKNMASSEVNYAYNYHLLFDDFIENIPSVKKVLAVLRFIKNYNPDVVNVTGWAGDLSLTLSIIFSFFLGKKIIISNESTSFDHQRSFIKELVKKTLVKMADGFIVFGKTSKEYLLNLGANESQFIEEKGAVVDDKKIREIYETARIEKFLAGEVKTSHNFIFVGRIIGVKNIPILIRAFQEIKQSIAEAKDWGLIILGNGTLDEQIKLEISKGDQDIYKFDAVHWQTVPKYFSKSDCLVLPSKSEPWGLVVNEAMICGLGVIVSNACGCKDDLVAGNGFVFEANNQNELKECMINFVINVDRRESMKKNSLEIIEQFKVELVAKRIISGFQKIYQQA
ncbi:glycosyltransferase family 4 protein [Lacihabitans soyangensis]|uniref:Glycosyltransferase n=1 Tax=Lacihabitans soyangensis TaxID=869394 RepID=A0AAE3KU59_9BACT|nr:glycosyltransferase family 4 protein [Lacihabitans soyangensis]MCP9764544.1 glycosyltransferase [Lacihabitans soyangensis]